MSPTHDNKNGIPHIGPDELPDEVVDLQNLILLTFAAAGWLIALGVGIVIVEIITIVLVIVNLQDTVKLVFGILVSIHVNKKREHRDG